MDQEPERSPQPVTPPATELPPVPIVSEAPPQLTPAEAPEPVIAIQTPSEEPLEAPAGPEEQMELPEEYHPPAEPTTLQWQASEYVEHEKSAKWFIILALITLAFVALAVFLLKNYTFAVLLVVMGTAIAVWAKRPAQQMSYQLDATGVWVNNKFFGIHEFRSFGLLQDGAIYAVVLLPNKRFSPGVTVYFPHELGEQIVDTLGAALPMQETEPDWIDKLTRKLNF